MLRGVSALDSIVSGSDEFKLMQSQQVHFQVHFQLKTLQRIARNMTSY
jgi:hypothetical protein